MADPFLGEVKLFACDFAPKGWALCAGQLLAISQNQALYSILGNEFGGDGRTTFALPDLRGRAPVHVGYLIKLGETRGEEAHTLSINEMPKHTHTAVANSEAGVIRPAREASWAKISDESVPGYGQKSDGLMAPSAIGNSGQSQPHKNMQPYLVMNYCIAVQGIFPPRN